MTQPGTRDIPSRLFRFTNRRFLLLILGLSLSGLTPAESFARDHRSFAHDHRSTHRVSHGSAIVSLFNSGSHPSPSSTPVSRLVVIGKKSYHPPRDKAAAADTLILAVQQFIAAGQTDDVTQRAIYLAPQVFFYGHNRTREQAAKQMIYFNRSWPQRRFASPDTVDIYAIPNRPGAYKVVSVYEYEMISREQDRMTGKARLTFIFEYGHEGPRIVGVNERLLWGTTRFYRDYNLLPVASDQETELGKARIAASR